jgi:hypothetical protein
LGTIQHGFCPEVHKEVVLGVTPASSLRHDKTSHIYPPFHQVPGFPSTGCHSAILWVSAAAWMLKWPLMAGVRDQSLEWTGGSGNPVGGVLGGHWGHPLKFKALPLSLPSCLLSTICSLSREHFDISHTPTGGNGSTSRG